MYVGQEYLDRILDHVRAEAPNMACGVIAGREGEIVKIYVGTNVEDSGGTRYCLDPVQQLAIRQEIMANGWELLAIYHSHPNSPAYPSETDVELAYYPEAVYLIISLAVSPPEVRAFRIVDGMISNEQLVIH